MSESTVVNSPTNGNIMAVDVRFADCDIASVGDGFHRLSPDDVRWKTTFNDHR
jgi:hypothetical protein